MRLSDIVQPKKSPQSLSTEQPKELKETPTAPSAETPAKPKVTRPRKSKIFPEGYIKEIKKEPAASKPAEQLILEIPSRKTSREIYAHAIEFSRDFWRGITRSPIQLPKMQDLLLLIDQIIVGLEQSPSQLLSFIEMSTPEDYLIAHISNVTLLTLAVSETLGWPKTTRKNAGVGAWLHDTGLVFHQPTYSKTKEFNPVERKLIQDFPLRNIEILSPLLESLPQSDCLVVKKILLQSQEKLHGGGYPQGLMGKEISQEAQLVRICDIYESLTHPRPYRGRKTPHETLRDLVELSGESYDGLLIKALWQTLTLFPPGTYVELNSGEIARVVELNKQSPTRPFVKVVVSSQRKRAKEERMIDLSQTKDVFIKRAVNECTLNLSDKKFLLQLMLQKWWFK